MMLFSKKLLSLVLLCSVSLCSAYNVGLMIVATGKYISFVPALIGSARKHFCPGHNVTFFVFTDGKLAPASDCVCIQQERLAWPYATMMRFEMYAKQAELLKKMDYLFASDADMLFVNTVGDEILGDLVATQHPGYVGKRGTYETRPESLAYIAPREGKIYFAGGFYGGRAATVLTMCAELTRRIYADLDHGIIAVWHDESHLNRYLINTPPTIVLSPSYCYPESWQLPYVKRLLALDKNHAEIRK